VTGPNGAGKTNLLESLHVGTQGFSPRTRFDAQIVRSGAERGRIALTGVRGTVPTTVEVTIAVGKAKEARLNGSPVRSAEQLRRELATLVFTPDRLAVVKGGPAARRAYFDRSLARLFPSRAELALNYGAALGQRNASLRAWIAGASSPDSLAPWTQQVAELGTELVLARRDLVSLLSSPFAERAGELGLNDAELLYEGEPVTVAELEERLPRDLERGATGAGPHLHDVRVLAGNRDLRTYGSQGEQRLAVLSLLLAEAQLLVDRGGEMPLLLLDDALSELDGDRRRRLSERLGTAGQAVITATGAEALPLAPAQLLRVENGAVLEETG
jgi:DNA replication and repair protein RecF